MAGKQTGVSLVVPTQNWINLMAKWREMYNYIYINYKLIGKNFIETLRMQFIVFNKITKASTTGSHHRCQMVLLLHLHFLSLWVMWVGILHARLSPCASLRLCASLDSQRTYPVSCLYPDCPTISIMITLSECIILLFWINKDGREGL